MTHTPNLKHKDSDSEPRSILSIPKYVVYLLEKEKNSPIKATIK